MKTKELKAILESHKKWLSGDGGERANLRGADLSNSDLRDADLRGADLSNSDLRYADLRGANLRDADLRYADLRGANLRDADLSNSNLSESKGLWHASLLWFDHGERGRMLTLALISGKPIFFCGCFKGSLEDLNNYIEKGSIEHVESRTMARDVLLKLLNFRKTKK